MALTVGKTTASLIRKDDSTERRAFYKKHKNMEHPKELKDLSSKMYYEMDNYHQAVHDLLETLSVELTYFEPISLTAIENVRMLGESIGPVSYDIGNLLEIIDPKLTNDIWALSEMQKIINSIL